jgi:hypothetical protein
VSVLLSPGPAVAWKVSGADAPWGRIELLEHEHCVMTANALWTVRGVRGGVVFDPESPDLPRAAYRANGWLPGGVLSLSGKARFRVRANWWTRRVRVLDRNGTETMRLRPRAQRWPHGREYNGEVRALGMDNLSSLLVVLASAYTLVTPWIWPSSPQGGGA